MNSLGRSESSHGDDKPLFELKLYLYPRYWSLLPYFVAHEANGMVLTDLVWLCFGIGIHWPTEDVEQEDEEDDES